MKYKVSIKKSKFEGLYPVYKPFFDSVTKLGGVSDGDIISFPDSVSDDDVTNIVKPYKDYILLERVRNSEK